MSRDFACSLMRRDAVADWAGQYTTASVSSACCLTVFDVWPHYIDPLGLLATPLIGASYSKRPVLQLGICVPNLLVCALLSGEGVITYVLISTYS